MKATAQAHPNIAFIKYWGNRDDTLRIPENGSISMNLSSLTTQTSVEFNSSYKEDRLYINDTISPSEGSTRVTAFLDIVRKISGKDLRAEVKSRNNFPMNAGIASSAAAFAAMALASTRALDLNLTWNELSALARRGSGSASRSIPPGFVEWLPGTDDKDSFAVTIAPPDYWQILDFIALLDSSPKKVGSSSGHTLARTSLLQKERVADVHRRIGQCRKAILTRDFDAFAEIVELDSNWLHAVMLSSDPPLTYLQPKSIVLMEAVIGWRKKGLPVCYTVDAGANVHIIGLADHKDKILERIRDNDYVKQVMVSPPGSGAEIMDEP